MEVRQPDLGPVSDVTVAVLGPGAVGGVLAVGLVRAGVRVICVARPDTADLIASQGLSLRHGQGSEIVHPDTTSELLEPVDLLLVTVKAPALEDALKRVKAAAATVIPLLNGIEHMQTLRSGLLESVVVAGSVSLIEAYLERPGVIVQKTPDVVLTLAGDAKRATADLINRSGAVVRINGSEAEVLWAKLARQAPVAAATALTQRPIGELRSDPEWRQRLQEAVDETCAVAAREGVSLTPEAQWEIIDAMPPRLTSSTARDVAAGRLSELDAITGAAVRAGRRLGVPTPALERLLIEAEDACRARSR
jgi:2-dehydropantoate 2-reductase